MDANMRLVKYKATYKLPHNHEIHSVTLRFKRVNWKLVYRPMDFGLPTLTRGIPTSFSLGDKNQIEFYPIPDRAYTVEIYYSVVKKI